MTSEGPTLAGLSAAFANTQSFGRTPDTLSTRVGFSAWLSTHGLATPPGVLDSPALGRIVHSEALRLRSAIRQLFHDAHGQRTHDTGTLFVINRLLERSPRVSVLGRASSGRLTIVDRWRSHEEITLLAPIALDAAELVTRVDPRRLRECAARDCRHWFVDTSKGGQRRWCSMSLCGNRAKAARHRRRHATS